MKILSLFSAALALSALLVCVSGQGAKPIVRRPRSARSYTTALTVDGGGMRAIIPIRICIEIENAIKRYLLANPKLLPRDEDISSEDDFVVLLADYFDAMSGVSAGSWVSGYLASKGGNGAAEAVFSDRRIIRRYGRIVPGQARGLEVFFLEYGETFYPQQPLFNLTPPMIPLNLTAGLNLTNNPLVTGGAAAALGFLPGIEIPGINRPFYPVEGLETALDLFLGDVKLSELSTYYVVHAYDLIRRQNLYFVHDDGARRSVTFTSAPYTRNRPREFPPPTNDEEPEYEPDRQFELDKDFYMKDLLRASSALPGFHEAKVMSAVEDPLTNYSCIDGAAITNNPALQAVIFLTTPPRSIPISDIALISLGTGVVLLDLEGNVDSSQLGWLLNQQLITLSSDGAAENVQSQVDYLFYSNPEVLPGQYLRVQVTADRNTTLGEALGQAAEFEALPELRRAGVAAQRRYKGAIDDFVANFIFA